MTAESKNITVPRFHYKYSPKVCYIEMSGYKNKQLYPLNTISFILTQHIERL